MSKSNRLPCIYVPVRYLNHVEKYCLASAGPNANLTGMRNLYWGDAPVVKCGAYLYKVSYEGYDILKGLR